MMITGSGSCYSNVPQGCPATHSTVPEYVVSSSSHDANSSAPETQTKSFLYNLTLLKEKIHQMQSLATIFVSPDDHGENHLDPNAIAVPAMASLIQEIIVTASSLMFTCQQISATSSAITPGAASSSANINTNTTELQNQHVDELPDDWYCDDMDFPATEEANNGVAKSLQDLSPLNNNEIIFELNADDLLAKYTHYCQFCGKGFKRDANLRMHMRAHGDEYKSSAALSNPMKKNKNGVQDDDLPRKYSCPQEGCRWNQKHAKFQPLKSMICVKNHYKRSHCPKMYVCKRCNRKQFALLSDLRTHEKHCGDVKWKCSCGTTFSRKDKLMGHVAMFSGHTPVVSASSFSSSMITMKEASRNSGQIYQD